MLFYYELFSCLLCSLYVLIYGIYVVNEDYSTKVLLYQSDNVRQNVSFKLWYLFC